MENTKAMVIVLCIVTFALCVAAYLLYQENLKLGIRAADLEAKALQLSADVGKLNSDMLQLSSRTESGLSQLGSSISSLDSSVNKELKDIEEALDLCTKDNPCKLRVPGTGYRCNPNGSANMAGPYWCMCDVNCDLKMT